MFKPLALYIGFRYTRAKRRKRFISFISLVSMIGIALGVCVLIVVLSVMNGFDQQIRERIFTMVPHVTITGLDGTLSDWNKIAKRVQSEKNILGMAPYVTGQGLMMRADVSDPVLLVGILPDHEDQVSALSSKMVQGKLSALQPGHFGIVLGQNLADHLGVTVGQKVNVLVPQATITPVGMLPQFKRFTVVGIFHVGTGFEFDSSYAFMQLSDAQKLIGLPANTVSGLQLKITDLFQADPMTNQLQKQLGFSYQVSNWTDQYGAFYHAVQMEKNIMFLILLLLIAVAVFNLVSSLVMLVNDKQSDIAILRTLGATPRTIMAIFMVQGTMIGVWGTLLGLILGVELAWHITTVVDVIQRTLHVELFTSNVYFVNYLPSQLWWSDVIKICVTALLMSLLATLYPAWRAAKVDPVEALRYE